MVNLKSLASLMLALALIVIPASAAIKDSSYYYNAVIDQFTTTGTSFFYNSNATTYKSNYISQYFYNTTNLPASNITSGTFGSDVGGGNYAFPSNLTAQYYIGSAKYLTDMPTSFDDSGLVYQNGTRVFTGGDVGLGWQNLTSYPPACIAGEAITQLGDAITCSSFLTTTGMASEDSYLYVNGSRVLTGLWPVPMDKIALISSLTNVTFEEFSAVISGVVNLTVPVIVGNAHSNDTGLFPLSYGTGFYNRIIIIDKDGVDDLGLSFTNDDLTTTASFGAVLSENRLYADIEFTPYDDDSYSLGNPSYRWKDLNISRDATIGNNLDAIGNVTIEGDLIVKGNITGSSPAHFRNGLISYDNVSAPRIAIGPGSYNPVAPEALRVNQTSTTSYNVISGYGDLNNYLQLNIQNFNNGTAASSDIVATNNVGTETNNYIDMGINSNTYNQAEFSSMLANDSYVYNKGGNLVIGTGTAGKAIKLIAGGTGAGNETARISLHRFNITGYATYWSYYGEMYFGGPAVEVYSQHIGADRWECLTPEWIKGDVSAFELDGATLMGFKNSPGIYSVRWSLSSYGEDFDTLFGIGVNGDVPTNDCMSQEFLTGHYAIQSASCLMRVNDGDKLCLMASPMGFDEAITMSFGNLNVNYIGD
jgi:hypothetical protein